MTEPSTPRIISLIASSTEILVRMGYERFLVGRSHECDYPATVLSLPAVTSPKFPTDGTSYEIDQRIRAIVQEGLSVYRVDAEKVKQLAPTHIVTQVQCQICAVSLRDVDAALKEITGCDPKVIHLEPYNMEGVFKDIEKIGEGLNDLEAAQRLIAKMKSELAEIYERFGNSPQRKSLVCIEWIKPLMSAGHWTPELTEIAGGNFLLGKAGLHSPILTFEDLLAADPDVLLIAPCGLPIERTMREVPLLQSHPQWKILKAVQNGQVYVADGNQYFNRPGPRLVDTARIIAEALHGPRAFSDSLQNVGYRKL